MTMRLYDLIEAAFSYRELTEALVSKISDYIDYDEVAEILLDDLAEKISETAAEIGKDYLA